MRSAEVVIGANFGDEGKGLVTDFLASQHKESLVVRFNGGSQASHTVITPEGKRHVFSHIPSGTYAGAHGYLSRFFIVNPMIFRKEMGTIKTAPVLYVDNDAMVSTPFDMLINQGLEKARSSCGTGRHGSCGLGINETVTRTLSGDRFRITVSNLYDDAILMRKVDDIQRNYVPTRLSDLRLGWEHLPVNPKEIDVISGFFQDVFFFRENTMPTGSYLINLYDHVIFEGAQGLLLDEASAFYPHVTRSRTGLTNVVEICGETNIKSLDVTYVSRCYLTRHGSGPLPHEVAKKPYSGIRDDTNLWNAYQGPLRFAPLNLDLLKVAIQNDLAGAGKMVSNAGMAITCLDQIDSDNFDAIIHDKKTSIKVADLTKQWAVKYVSYGPTRNDIKTNGPSV